MDLPVAPTALIDLLRAWFYAKDRSIVMGDDTYIIGRSYTCVKNLLEFDYTISSWIVTGKPILNTR